MKLNDLQEKEAWSYDQVTEGLDKYDEQLGNNQKWCEITEIVVPTEHDKQQLLKAFEYIHNLKTIDSDFMAVNSVMHLYEEPDKIKVKITHND